MKMKLKMQLFGSFFLSNGTVTLGEENIHSNKLTRLLVFLLLNRETGLSHQKLIDMFWEDKSKNPQGALKNLMYRLRGVLSVLGDEQYICTMRGVYRWNPKIEVETDYERFEELNQKLRNSRMKNREKKQLCQEILACYRGNVSPVVAEEPGLIPKAAWYQSLYMETVGMLCEIYEQEKAWSSIEMICNQAIAVDAFDEEVHCWLLRSLHAQKKYDLAAQHYDRTNKTFYETMGIGISEKVRTVFYEMMQNKEKTVSDVEMILREAQEIRKPEGAFLCDYQVFRQIYRIEVRRISRVGVAEYVMLLTIYRKENVRRTPIVDSSMREGIEILENLICSSLRVGDVVARYSPTQYIVMLPTCSYEAGKAVGERIKENFQRGIGAKRLKLKYELAELCSTE